MVKFIIGLILSLGLLSRSFAQTDSLQAQDDSIQIQTDEMVCFLTDANTITCFVAPDEYSNQGQETNSLNEEKKPQDNSMENDSIQNNPEFSNPREKNDLDNNSGSNMKMLKEEKKESNRKGVNFI